MFAFALSLPTVARGLSVEMSLEDRVRAAHTVVLADIVSSRVRTGGSSRGPAIETVVELSTISALKGKPPRRIPVVLPGGATDDLVVWSPDTPVFVVGRRALVFLDAGGRVIGGMDGRLDVASGMVAVERQSWAHVRDRVLVAAGRLEGPVLSAPASGVSAASVSAAGVPVISGITPGSASAGTRSRVTVSGSGFGVSRGSGKVSFFYRDGRDPIQAARYVSWSDTAITVEVPTATVNGYQAAAGSGPVTVTDSSGRTSPGHDFVVTFAFGGVKWAGTSMTYRVAAPSASFETMVDAAASTWSAVSAFRMHDGGPIAAPTASTNDVYWDALATGDLGRAYISYMPGTATGTIVSCDIALNTAHPWGDGTGDTFDVQSVVLHELGHWLNLRDLYGAGDVAEVMYGIGTRGSRKRELHAHDIAGIRYIYGSSDSHPPTSSVSGVPSGWTSQTVVASISAADDSSGVRRTYYRVGSGPAYIYSGPVSFSTDQDTTLWYWSEDNAGNVETARSAAIRVDKSPPVTSADVRTFYADAATITLSAADGGSGVASTAWRLNGAEWRAGAVAGAASLGTHTLEYRSTDAVGNRESARTATFTVVAGQTTDVERLAGADRYLTAVKVSESSFATAAAVVLATGQGFPDALAAAGLAGALRAPVMLARPDEVPAEVVAEVRRLGASRIVAVGGARAVSDRALERAAAGAGVRWSRVWGADRYGTAAAVAAEIVRLRGAVPVVFLVRGDGFADALAASPYAYSQRAPILLTRMDGAPEVTVAAARGSGASEVVVAGGPAVLSDAAVTGLGLPWTRVHGSSRYATAVALTRHAMSRGWTTPTSVGVATGERFPDALSGGAAMGSAGGALLLTRSAHLTEESSTFLVDCMPAIRSIRVLGAEAAVSPHCFAVLSALGAP